MLFVFDDQDGAAVAEEFDDFEPVVEVGVVGAGVGDEEIEGAFGEEELMGGVVDFLAAEVPDVDAEGVAVWHGEVPADNVDAFGRFFVFGEFVIFAVDFFGEGGFACAAFADEDEFGFVKRNRTFFCLQVKSKS